MIAKRETLNNGRARRVLMLLENEDYPRDNRVYKQATALIQAGYEVAVICPASPGQLSYEVLEGVSVYRYPSPPQVNSKLLNYLIEYGYSMMALSTFSLVLYFRKGFDIVHAHTPPDILGMITAFYKMLGKRFVYDQQDIAPELFTVQFDVRKYQVLYQMLLFFEQLCYRFADLVVVPNQSYKAIAMERGHVPDKWVTVMRMGPDVGRLPDFAESCSPIWKSRMVLGYVGIIAVQDGVDYLIRALDYMVHKLGRTDCYCIIMGYGSAWHSVRELATQLDLDQYIWFTGWISGKDIRRYLLSLTDVCLAPEPSNPFNDRSTIVKIMEYMAMYKPVVAFDLPENRITAQDAALYAVPNDEIDFANKIIELIEDPERREQMGRLGRTRLESELDWPHQIHKFLEAYQILDRKG